MRDVFEVLGLIPTWTHFGHDRATLLTSFTTWLRSTVSADEEQTHTEEEWGEERMLAAAQLCQGLKAAEMISKLMEAADEFAAGANQRDDMTVVVVKVI